MSTKLGNKLRRTLCTSLFVRQNLDTTKKIVLNLDFLNFFITRQQEISTQKKST